MFKATGRALSKSFNFEVKTDNAGTSNDNQFRLPLVSSFNGSTAIVDWGDGSAKDTITSYNQSEVTHTFPSSGSYSVKISGQLRGWKFNNDGDIQKITNISNWGVFEMNEYLSFSRCTKISITAIDSPYLISSNISYSFYLCTSIKQLNVSKWNVSNTENFNALFFKADDMVITGLDKWDIGSATNLSNLLGSSPGMSTEDYDKTLISWEAQAPNTGLSVDFGGSKFTPNSLASAARDRLISVYSWTIADGGSI
ncbi:BspA family leucine-rich repeat surface protein [Polaribacter sp. IC073]|uniref:BspA family leucine-rich repeat surface protein n=1 Tax=Polaribacter sp. IC073 TaxID=2508540 RepID=UPI001673BA20|nr:BspA family leucine-rich repeat surface protein [Polaribacter sp. IC073]